MADRFYDPAKAIELKHRIEDLSSQKNHYLQIAEIYSLEIQKLLKELNEMHFRHEVKDEPI